MNLASRLLILLTVLASANAVAQGPRLRIRFDDNWRFLREPDVAASKASAIQWRWKKATDVSLNTTELPADLDAGDWTPVKIGVDVFDGKRGFAWYQGNLPTSPNSAQSILHFDSVDDNGAVFLNGHFLKKHEGWDDPFDVSVRQFWNPVGLNVVTVLVQNTDGPGGIMGSVTFSAPQPVVEPKEAAADFNDNKWRVVHLPHDYVVEGKFDPNGDVGHGSLPKPTAWYRKTFFLPTSYRGKNVSLEFEGVYRNSTLWLNGHKLGNHPSGYIGFRHEIDPFAHFGAKNELAVHVDPRQNEGWWYEGGGIYRHVWLVVTNPLHVAPHGTYVISNVKGRGAVLGISTSVENQGRTANFKVVSSVVDPRGKIVATIGSSQLAVAGQTNQVQQKVSLRAVTLWSIENPALYRLQTSVYRGLKLVDETETPFGIRTIRYDKDLGFFLNGKPVKLKGTCNHQDYAGVGIGMPDGLLDWRIRKLKEMGSNAYRCSHNPPAPELLDACDRLGMVVMDETRHFGDTESPKSPKGTKAENLSELKEMILRDRNHPSIIMWSLYNEEPLQGTDEGAKIFLAMRAAVRKIDPTRPCSGATNGGYDAGIENVTELFGYNYSIWAYNDGHKRYPNLPLFGSETASTVSTRGIYANDEKRGYVSAYDVNVPGWGATAETAWKAIAERPFMAGEFVWTGFDYKGEPTPYGWPCINSHFGIMDICGFPKDNFFYYQAWWGDKPVTHIMPQWVAPQKPKKPVDVWVYSRADKVELLLNGRSLGVQKMPVYGHVHWEVPYQPGVLVAKSYINNKIVSQDRVETTGAPAAIRLKTTRPNLLADSEDLAPVEVEIVDSHGRVVPISSNLVKFTVQGRGAIAGVGNGDPSSHEPDKASQRHAFNGLCMVLVRSTDRRGTITLRAQSPGLASATIQLTTQ